MRCPRDPHRFPVAVDQDARRKHTEFEGPGDLDRVSRVFNQHTLAQDGEYEVREPGRLEGCGRVRVIRNEPVRLVVVRLALFVGVGVGVGARRRILALCLFLFLFFVARRFAIKVNIAGPSVVVAVVGCVVVAAAQPPPSVGRGRRDAHRNDVVRNAPRHAALERGGGADGAAL